jgi:hypothetical protein
MTEEFKAAAAKLIGAHEALEYAQENDRYHDGKVLVDAHANVSVAEAEVLIAGILGFEKTRKGRAS